MTTVGPGSGRGGQCCDLFNGRWRRDCSRRRALRWNIYYAAVLYMKPSALTCMEKGGFGRRRLSPSEDLLKPRWDGGLLELILAVIKSSHIGPKSPSQRCCLNRPNELLSRRGGSPSCGFAGRGSCQGAGLKTGVFSKAQ